MWNLKYNTISPRFYELLFNIELKGYTALDFNNFYNHVNMCLNAFPILRWDLLTAYQPIKIHSNFQEYFSPDHSHPLYYCKCIHIKFPWKIPFWPWKMTPLSNLPWYLRPTMLSLITLTKYQDRKFYPDFSMRETLILEVWMATTSLI